MSIVLKSPLHHDTQLGPHTDRFPRKKSPRKKSPRNKSPTTLVENISKQQQDVNAVRKLNNGAQSESSSDKEILDLLQHVSQKHKIPNLWMKTFHLYPIALEVCQVVTGDQQLPGVGFCLPKKTIKRRVYQLVFDTLYHQEVLEELLVESSFYAKFFTMHADKMLLHIMLFDFQSHKFGLRLPRNNLDNIAEPILRISQALWYHRIKLNATFARMRVKENALKISQLIPDRASREFYKADQLCPCFARINSIRVQNVQTEVVNQLSHDGFSLVDAQKDIYKRNKSVCLAKKHLLVFSPDCREMLDTHSMVENGSLILQDGSSYRFVDGIQRNIEQCGGDIIVTEMNSGIEVSHIATLLGSRGTVFVFNMQSKEMQPIKTRLFSLGLRNIEFVEIPFVYVSNDNDDVYSNVKMIVCLPALATPSTSGHRVDFILREGDHMLSAMLQPPNLGAMKSSSQSSDLSSLSSALTFTEVESIVYKTQSHHLKDNIETTVRETLDEHNSKNIKNKYIISTTPHESMDYFTAVIERESEKPAALPPPRDVIERAIIKGIINAEGISDYMSVKTGRNRKSKGQLKNNSVTMCMTISSRQKVVQKKETIAQKIFRP